jgi:drug/metabolite transporter (DMT)-like permease
LIPTSQTKNRRRALIQIHVAVLFFGLAGLFGKLVLLPSTIIVLGRVFFATIFLALVLVYRKQEIKLRQQQDYFFMGLMGVILAVHWVTFFQAIQVSTVAIGLLTFSTFPVFVTFLEPFFFKEKLAVKDIFVALVAFIGVALVIEEFELTNSMTQGALWGIVSGFTFALLSIMNRKYVKEYSSIVVAFYQDSIATLVLLPFIFISAPAFRLIDILLLFILGVIFTGLAHTLFIQGLANVKAQKASIIASLEPVYGIIAAILLFGSIPTLRVVLGGVIILGAAFYATVKN